MQFIQEYIDGYYQLIYPFEDKLDIKNTKAIELAKKTVVDDFCDWAKRLNLIAYNSSEIKMKATGYFRCESVEVEI